MREYQSLINQMNIEEKCGLLSGAKEFETRSYRKYAIPSLRLADGPHGLRKQEEGGNHLGLGTSVKATCFPTASAIANSWNPQLGEKIGEALGIEAAAQGVGVLLGPGLCMKRSTLCGRNFEYFSEDPYLSGKMAAGYIRGIQKNGLVSCPKHFAVNNQELLRMSNDSIVDERTLREIYLTAFEIAVQEGKPKAIMSSYNLVNGTYANENSHLLNEILRNEWNFNGVIVSDWGGSCDSVAAVHNTSDLEMPVPGVDSISSLVKAVKTGKLKEEEINSRVEEVLSLIMPTCEAVENAPKQFSVTAHHQLAQEAAAEAIVLMKNENQILPLAKGTRVAVIGDFAAKPRYQGAGSSLVNPTKLETLISAVKDSDLEFDGFATGYKRHGGEEPELLKEAISIAIKADVVLLCLGLDEIKESEGLDRRDMGINKNQITLLHAIEQANRNIIVLLSGGSAIEMPWIDSARAVVDGYLGGQAGAKAMLDIITGKINPSGKLSESWPLKLSDTPAYHYFPGRMKTAEYREGLYVGYRYYETACVPVLFPFGYGLSYTSYKYTELEISEKAVHFKLSNTGIMDGVEIAQLYVHRITKQNNDNIFRPEEELKGFTRVALRAGETKKVTIALDDKAFRYFDIKANQWKVEGGCWELRIGASSKDIRLNGIINITGVSETGTPYKGKHLPSYYSGKIQEVSDKEFEILLGRSIPDNRIHGWIDKNITFGQLIYGRSPVGWIIWCLITVMLRISEKSGKPKLNLLFVYNMPIRALQKMTDGAFSMGMVEGLVWEINGFWGIGFCRFIFETVIHLFNSVMVKSRLNI